MVMQSPRVVDVQEKNSDVNITVIHISVWNVRKRIPVDLLPFAAMEQESLSAKNVVAVRYVCTR